ncbi:Lysosome membrane protein 2 [Papilio xuthus]|uniref:Lysosome membrane protein 2 n=1 Tax=Papilio xuthus TaxID=66420 RepID=A0A194PSW7_PAPXU|nr:Lysosome membrane protein 2 [Papilio xuthus]
MEHQNLEKMTSTSLMLPRENGDKIVIINPNSGVGKILIREDTALGNLPGCSGWSRAHFNCSGVKKQWSVLCWGQQSDKRYYFLLVLLSATFVLSLIGTILFCFTNTINNAILSNMVIRNNSVAYDMWRRPTVQPLMKVYLFNYTNWEDVKERRAKRLHVEEVGPYGVISKAKDMQINGFAQMTLNTALNFGNHPDAFVKLPVHRFLWGYDDTIIDTAKPILSLQGKLNFKKFGLLVTKNGTVSERLTINTGEIDKDKMNIIQELDGREFLPYWSSRECNSIEASDGTIFPPSMLDRNKTLYVLYTNLCRRLPFVYEKDVETADGVQLMRYRMPLDVFDDPAHNSANQCFCELDTGLCPPRGVINVTACAMGAPALASFPHFYLGDPMLREQVTGLKPNPERHISYLDIHPTLGIALTGKSTLQLNIQVRKTSMYTSLSFLDDGLILPVAWIDMGVDELPKTLKSLIYHGTYSTAAVQLGLTVICIISLIVSGICLFVLFVRRRQKPCATAKKITEEELKPQLS